MFDVSPHHGGGQMDEAGEVDGFGDRPDWFISAMMSGADVAIFDLEDAVAPASKDIDP